MFSFQRSICCSCAFHTLNYSIITTKPCQLFLSHKFKLFLELFKNYRNNGFIGVILLFFSTFLNIFFIIFLYFLLLFLLKIKVAAKLKILLCGYSNFYSSKLSNKSSSSSGFSYVNSVSRNIPVPDGINPPIITFSFNPSNGSFFPLIAASVSTLVVS